ncbi:MAG: DNA polymerase III subunit delta [Treponema sp.]|jgi:DNA polymerase-3 subunit delta|nr:DNA polymerase III subunit delta [Treponema sp.]
MAAGVWGAYLFLGPELGEKQDALKLLRESLGPGLEEHSYYAGETSLSDVVSALQNGSLFASRRLFTLKNAELIKKKDEVELLAAWMKEKQSDTVLVLISGETSLAKGLENAVPKERKRIFWELFENRKREWVDFFFRRQGLRISEDGIEAILEMVENNTASLSQACLHLALMASKEEPVGEEMVDRWLSHTREESAFSLFGRIARGDLNRALESLHSLLAAKESPQSILGVLAWCFRKLRDYLALEKAGNINDSELKKIGLGSQRVRQDYIEAGRRYSSADRALSLIAEYDLLTRNFGAGMEQVLTDTFVVKLMSG